MSDASARAQAAADQAKEDANSTLVVDWSKTQRSPFQRLFLRPPGNIDAQSAAIAFARRAQLGIQVESDPRGVDSTPVPVGSFAELQVLPPWLLSAVGECRWEVPMPVQAQALPILLSGRNLIGIAQTGSGKTGAFLLPAIVHASAQQQLRRADPGPIVLVVAPTRELAVQISDEAEKLLKHSASNPQLPGGLRSCCFYGGGKKFEQLRKFTFDGSHICVATPGRLIDFCKEGKVSLKRVTYFCLDEADRMLDFGFSGDMDALSAAIRPERQTVFFSATWPKEVQALACRLCTDADGPVTIRVGRGGGADAAGRAAAEDGGDGELLAREGITQQVVVVDFPDEQRPWDKQDEVKKNVLDKHIKDVMAQDDSKMIIFVNQKHFADELSTKLWDEGVYVDAIHGGKQQERRLAILNSFRKGETRLLIATDVIGRGLDIPKVSHVVIYNMNGVEDYIHRIGRTGRGKDGKGHALVFFEHAPAAPDSAKELIAVLEKSKQPVPPELVRIAEEVASGKRAARYGGSWASRGRGSWSSGGGGGGRWASWDWKSSTGDWKSGDHGSNGWNGGSAGSGDAAPKEIAATT